MNRRRLLQELTAVSPLLWWSRVTSRGDPVNCAEVVIDPCSFRTAANPGAAAGAAERPRTPGARPVARHLPLTGCAPRP